MVRNNSATLFAFIISPTTSSIDFGVLVKVVGSPNPYVDYPNSCTILLPSSNSNENPSVDFGLLGGTSSSIGLNFSKTNCVATIFIYNSLACRPSCVCYYCCYKCCSKCYKCYILVVVSIQFSYTFASKCRCSSPFENLVSCSLLASWLYSFNYLSCEDAICCTLGLCSLNCVSCGVGIYGIFVVYLATYATIGTTLTNVGTTNGSTLPLIIFYALKFMISCSLFTPKPKASPSSTLFFLLKALLGKFVATFFIFSNLVYISSLVLKTLVGGFYGFSF